MNNSIYRCPKCGSENTSALSVIHQGGTSSGTFSAASFGLESGFVGTGGTLKGSTVLAKQASPPRRPDMSAGEIILAIIGFFIVFFIVGGIAISYVAFAVALLFLSGFVYLRYLHLQKATEKWKAEVAEWKKAWMCLRCGNRFSVT